MTNITLQAISELKTAQNHIDRAVELLKGNGVKISSFYYSIGYHGDIIPVIVRLETGIGVLSMETETEIDNDWEVEYGHLKALGIHFEQRKIPVEREARYA